MIKTCQHFKRHASTVAFCVFFLISSNHSTLIRTENGTDFFLIYQKL